ncbi:unnamed protein product [Closterium sp. NIES-65]|nr:unnamed protein product [Closterium sp. NIES-65]
MRADIYEHAAGTLLPRLAADNIDIPSQEHPELTKDRPAPHPQHDACHARLEQLQAEQLSGKREMAILERSVAFLSHVMGYTPEQVQDAAVQLLQDGDGVKVCILANSRTKHAPPTPQRPSGFAKPGLESPEEVVKCTDTRVSLGARFMGEGVQFPAMAGTLPQPGTIPHLVISRQQRVAAQGIPTVQKGMEAGQPRNLAAAHHESPREGGDDEDVDWSSYTGLSVEKSTGKWAAKILTWEGVKRRQHRLGAYTTPREAAQAFAAAAFVLRPGVEMEKTIPLTDAQKGLLKGCDKDAVAKLVGARMWWRWRKWATVVQELNAKKKRVRKSPSANTRGKKRQTNVNWAGVGVVEAMGSDGGGTLQTELVRNAGPDLMEKEAQSKGAIGKEDEDDGVEGEEGDEGSEGDAKYVCEEDGDDDEETEGIETTEATQQRDYPDAKDSESAQSASKGESNEGQAKTKPANHVHSVAINASKGGKDKPLEVEGDDPLVALRATPEGSQNPSGEVPVYGAVFDSLKRAQDDNAKTVARLEEFFMKALAESPGGSCRRKAEKQRDPGLRCANPKHRRVEARSDASEGDKDDESDDSRRRHMRSSRSPVLQSALDLLPADKAWKRMCDLVRVYLFMSKSYATMTFYPSSDDKTDGVCAVLDRLPYT